MLLQPKYISLPHLLSQTHTHREERETGFHLGGGGRGRSGKAPVCYS